MTKELPIQVTINKEKVQVNDNLNYRKSDIWSNLSHVIRKPTFCRCKDRQINNMVIMQLATYELRREKTGFLHMQKQRHRSAVR